MHPPSRLTASKTVSYR